MSKLIMGAPIQPVSVSVQAWFPTPDASGKPTQVHVILENDPTALIPAMVMRFKSREGLQRFVADLTTTADEPEGKT